MLTERVAARLESEAGLPPSGWREVSTLLVDLLLTAVERRTLDSRCRPILNLAQFVPPLTIRQIVSAVHSVERIALDDLAAVQRVGATPDSALVTD